MVTVLRFPLRMLTVNVPQIERVKVLAGDDALTLLEQVSGTVPQYCFGTVRV